MDRVIKSFPLFLGQREILRQTLPKGPIRARILSQHDRDIFRPCRRFRGEKLGCPSLKRLLLRRRSPGTQKNLHDPLGALDTEIT